MTLASLPLANSTCTPEEQFEEDVKIVLQSASAEHRNGNLGDAERLYGIVLDVCPHHLEANYSLGTLALQRNQPEAAIARFEIAIGIQPGNAEYWVSYIDALSKAGEQHAARIMLEAAQKRGLTAPALDVLANRLASSGSFDA
jgi:tetratricopeptide (TPR) repeat protein